MLVRLRRFSPWTLLATLSIGLLPAQAEDFKSAKGFSLTCPDGWRAATKEEMKQRAESATKAGLLDATAAMILGPASNGFAAKIVVSVVPGRLVLDAKSEDDLVAGVRHVLADAGNPLAIKTGHITIGGKQAFTMEYEKTDPTSKNDLRQWTVMLPGKRQWYSITCAALKSQWDDVSKGFRETVLNFKADLDDADAKKGSGEGGEDTRLTLKEIQELRRRPMPAGEIAETVVERGRGFEVTVEVAGQLRSLGFTAAQIDAVKEAADEPLVPGKSLATSDEQRDLFLKEMTQVAAKSGAAIAPIELQHVTLWAAKDMQETYLADLRKAEKFFHTKCAEPIRSGLDKRSTHIILLKDHAEYEAWWRAMLDLFGKQFEEKDNPGGNAQFRQQVLRGPIFHGGWFSVVSMGEMHPVWVHHNVAFSAGYQYVAQLATRRAPALQVGFGNWAETAVCGSPVLMGSEIVYGRERTNLIAPVADWGLIVKECMRTSKATSPADLLKTDSVSMAQPVYAERWALVGLLNQQPAKFGKLLLALKDSDSDLAVIAKVYGWNEKEVAKELRAYVLAAPRGAAGNQAAPKTAASAKAKPPAAAAPAADKLRTWQDASGQFSVQAEFVSAMAGVAKLRKPDGSTISVPMEKLSDEDQMFIRNRGR